MAKTLLDLFKGSPHDVGVEVGSITAAEQDENGVKSLTIEDVGDFTTSPIEDTFNSSDHSSDVTADDITPSEQDESGVKTLGITDIGDFTTSTIEDTFNSSDHSSDVVADDITSDEQDATGVKTRTREDVSDFEPASLESIFSMSNYNSDIQAKTIDLVQQELTGIRIHSLVELNNPLLYGTDVPRIMLRTTATLNTIKEGTDAGLSPAMTAITAAASAASSFLGIPVRALPTSIADAIDNPNGLLTSHPKLYDSLLTKASSPMKIKELSATDIISVFNNSGTDLGKLLRNSGGTPATAGIQAAGQLLNLGKRKARALLNLDNPAATAANPNLEDYLDFNIYEKPYTEKMNSTAVGGRNYTQEGGDVEDFEGIDLTMVSPVWGLDRSYSDYPTRYGDTSNAFELKNPADLSKYTPKTGTEDGRYTTKTEEKYGSNATLESKYGLISKTVFNADGTVTHIERDKLNEFSINDTYTTKDLEEIDLIPFWIGRKDSEKKTHFRTLLTGISETVSPSWNSSNFFGNPFAYHTYTGIERSVTFSLQMYCSSQLELQKMWERISTLTSYTYPKLDAERLVIPPIIDFRLGDIYKKKVGYLDSLSYTFPDNGTWEIENGKQLPKVVDVSISIKFIEQMGDFDDGSFYSFTSDAPQQTFSTNALT